MAKAALFILALPVLAIVFLFKHPKLLVVCALLGVGIFAYVSCNNAKVQAGVTPPHYQVVAPSHVDAPKIFQTSSRLYYAVQYQNLKYGTDRKIQSVDLTKYYEYRGKKWVVSTTLIPLDRKYYGEINVYDNKN